MRRKDIATENIGDAIRGAQRNLDKSYGRGFEEQSHNKVHVTSKGNVICYDVSCPICQKEATKVTTTTVYHKPNSHESKVKEIERQKQLEDFKYNVSKNCTIIEK